VSKATKGLGSSFSAAVIGVLGGYALHIAMKAIEDIVLSDK
jgi:hypothetical protein